MPAADAPKRIRAVKTDSSANAVTMTRAGSDTLEGATTHALSAQYDNAAWVTPGDGVWYRED